MVKVKLDYNPYTLNTIVEFNNQPPRINSLVEKYQNQMLQTWINQIPKIFYDEMNGYDFELDFYGTKLDFEELQKSFNKAKVSKEEVELFLKNSLSDRYSKDKLINNLLDWLKSNPNKRFDYDLFRQEHTDLFDDKYLYMIIHGDNVDISKVSKEVAVEKINNVTELEQAYLTYVPILFCIDTLNEYSFQKDLVYILNHQGIEESQLFFLIDRNTDHGIVKRVIQDLGVTEVKIVDEVYDEQIKRYLNLYPISDYIKNVVKLFNDTMNPINEEIQQVVQEHRMNNKELFDQIDVLDNEITALKKANEQLMNMDNLHMPSDVEKEVDSLLGYIENWKKRRNKCNDEYEAKSLSEQFNNEVYAVYRRFLDKTSYAFDNYRVSLMSEIRGYYVDAKVNMNFIPDVHFDKSGSTYIPDYKENLISMKKIEQVKKMILKGLFSAPEYETTDETVWYLQEWRDYVKDSVKQFAQSVIDEKYEKLESYYYELSMAYRTEIESLIDDRTETKKMISLQLSEDEKIVQMDVDWITNILDQMEVIVKE